MQPIQPKPQTQDLTPTPLPAPVATIQAAPTLPDPAAMEAALKAISTPDVFRDMSAKQELGKLLSDLIEGAVDMAQAAAKAKEIQAKMDTDVDRQQREQAVAALESHNSVRRAEIEARREQAQQITPAEAQHAIKVSENQVAAGNRTPAEHKEYVDPVLGNVRGASPKRRRTIALDLEFKYPDTSRMEGRYRISLEDIDGLGLLTPDATHKVFTGTEYFAVPMTGQRLRITVHGYDSVLLPEQTGAVALHYTDTSGIVTLPAKGERFVVRGTPVTTEAKVTAKTKAEAQTKLMSSAKLSAKDIVEVSEGSEQTAGVGDETTYEFTIKHLTRGMTFTLI